MLKNEPARGEIDFQKELPPGMEIFTIPWLMRRYHTGPQHWINLIESGALKATNLSSPNASKTMYRIPRSELVSFLKSKTL